MTKERQQLGTRTFLLPLALDDSKDNIFCLFTQNQVVEILGPRPIQQIPLSPAYLKGVVHYFDQLLPVINLDELCRRNRGLRQESYQQLMVIRTGMVDDATGEPLKAAVAASARVRIANFSGQMLTSAFIEQEAPLSLKNSGVLRGFFQHQTNYIALFDLSRLLLGTFGTPWQAN